MSRVLRVMDLKPNLENVTVRVRVIEVHPPRRIQTKKGERTISNAVVGDSTGRVDVTIWGEKTATLRPGEAVEVSGAWTTVFRGVVHLNIGRSTRIKQIDDPNVPGVESIPNEKPRAPLGRGRGWGGEDE